MPVTNGASKSVRVDCSSVLLGAATDIFGVSRDEKASAPLSTTGRSASADTLP